MKAELQIYFTAADLLCFGIEPKFYTKCHTDAHGRAGAYLYSLRLKLLGFSVELNNLRISGGTYIGQLFRYFWIKKPNINQ